MVLAFYSSTGKEVRFALANHRKARRERCMWSLFLALKKFPKYCQLFCWCWSLGRNDQSSLKKSSKMIF